MPLIESQPQFTPLDSATQLDQLVAASLRRPVLIIKHSPACGTSFQALDELEANTNQLAAVDMYLLDVLRHRVLSQSIARRFNVRHESPQVLLLVNGQLHWSASHYAVTVDAIRRALASASADVPGSATAV